MRRYLTSWPACYYVLCIMCASKLCVATEEKHIACISPCRDHFDLYSHAAIAAYAQRRQMMTSPLIALQDCGRLRCCFADFGDEYAASTWHAAPPMGILLEVRCASYKTSARGTIMLSSAVGIDGTSRLEAAYIIENRWHLNCYGLNITPLSSEPPHFCRHNFIFTSLKNDAYNTMLYRTDIYSVNIQC